jgi:hypothetical protein
MRVHFEDHAGFHRATLHVAVASSALAAGGALAGAERFGPEVAVLAAACATLALALGHLRVVVDPVADAVARAAAGVDGAGRALLARAASAHDRIARGARRNDGAGAGAVESRALAGASSEAVRALAELLARRQGLARAVEDARPAGVAGELEALEASRDAASDPIVREAYARAAATARERAARAAALEGVVARIDARAFAAVGELEAAALASAARHDLGAADPAAALAPPCERLRAATADLGAEHDAFAELAAL